MPTVPLEEALKVEKARFAAVKVCVIACISGLSDTCH